MNPNALLDPKLIEVMRKIESAPVATEDESDADLTKKPKRPTTLEAFLSMTGMTDFPDMERVKVPNPDFLEMDDLPVGGADEIKTILREAAPIDLSALDKCEHRLLSLEARLRHYSDQILSETKRTSRLKNKLFHAPPVEDLSEQYLAKAQKSSQDDMSLHEQLAELQKRRAGYCKYPGFRPGELTELPSQLEAPMILHRVTKAQDFNKRPDISSGFRRFWKKAFLSEASIAMLQDMFWWFYIEKFDKTVINKENQNRLYDRIADSFNALFLSVHPEIKDKFFTVYCDCLSQAIFAACHEAFPESDSAFDDNFKQDLCNMVHEWITGIKPPPQTFKAWNIRRLEPKFKGQAAKKEDDLQQKMIQVAALNKEPKNNLDIEGFQAAVKRMGDGTTSRLGTAPLEPTTQRQPTALASLPVSGPLVVDTMTVSRQAQCGTPRRHAKESHQVGPGAEFSRVTFNVQGRSPLVQHYLHMRRLKELDQIGMKVTRTEITKRPPDGETYRQVISKSLQLSDQMKNEYQKVCDYTKNEIAKIEHKKLLMFYKIESLKARVRDCRNPHELQMITDYIQSGEYERKEGLKMLLNPENAEKDGDETYAQQDSDYGGDDEQEADENQNVK